jgi:hypothetical protein
MRLTPALGMVMALAVWPSTAQEKFPFPIRVHGFLMGNLAVRSGAFVLGEERLHLDVSGASRSGAAFLLLKGDVFHDAVEGRAEGDLREAYAGYQRGPIDVRLGRQIVTWGVGDLFFINDVFPKDWESFFSGRPMEYLKRGTDAVRVQYSSGTLNVDLVATPLFRPDALPSPERFFLYNPFPGASGQQEVTPAARAGNSEVALRLFRRAGGFDFSVYGYRGYWRTPGMRADSADGSLRVTRFYPRLAVIGASAQRNWLQGVVSLETGHYHSLDDAGGTDPSIPNSEWRVLAGYQRQLAPELTANVQGYAEILDAPGRDRVRGVFSLRLTQFLRYQSWRISVFFAHSPTDNDYFTQPEVSHRLTDKLSVTLGSNIFGGRRDNTFFGQMEKNDNVYLNVRFDF